MEFIEIALLWIIRIIVALIFVGTFISVWIFDCYDEGTIRREDDEKIEKEGRMRIKPESCDSEFYRDH